MTAKGRGLKDERRLFQRIEVNLPARITDLTSGRVMRVKARDVSAQGVGMLTKERLDKSAPVKISVSIPDRKRRPLVNYGRIAWIRPESRWSWRMGVSLDKPQFVALSPLLRS